MDGGRSRCRAAVVGPDGVREACGEGRGLPVAGRSGLPGVVRAVVEAAARCSAEPETIDVVSAGLAGMLGSFELAPVVAEDLSRRLGVERVVITGDVVTAYAGALGGLPGVVVVAGTGAAVFGATAEGDTARTDGWGHLLGDAGSGYWIGRRGLEAALRAHDGRAAAAARTGEQPGLPGASATLAGLAESHLGPLDGLSRQVESSDHPAATVASFAVHVAAAALRGDPVARAIWTEAAGELAGSAAACARRLFPPGRPVSVSWAGGLFDVGSPGPESQGARDLLLVPFRERLVQLWPDAVPTPPAGDALAGAALLAADPGLVARHVYDSAAVAAGSAGPRPQAVLH